MPHRSTSSQLICYLRACVEAVDIGVEVDTLYLDFAKAFDTVPHARLISKLDALNLDSRVFNWIVCYLTGRRQSPGQWLFFGVS